MSSPPRAQVPTLTVLSLTESFTAMWGALASDCGMALATAADVAELERLRPAVAIVSAGGAEESLPGVLRSVSPVAGEVAAVGALADHRLGVAALRAGAAEYFALPQDMELLRGWVTERAERIRAIGQREAFAAREGAKYRFDGIIGASRALRQALDRAARIIPHGAVTVLITGETGTGKELMARAIHYNGPRREAPFVDVNCAAIPEPLLESELFGHEKGAFTDARAAKPGLFEVAHGGTLFLDEIGHLPLGLQGKLLRALEERAIRRVGGTRNIAVDVRIIAATHVSLREAVTRGEFREDLYFRLNVIPLEIPPLRARKEDIPVLVRHFLSRFAREYGVREPELTPAAERALLERHWPGNVRELRNTLERALLLASSPRLDVADVTGDGGAPPAEETEAAAVGGAGAIPFPATIAEITRAAAMAMLQRCDGNKSEAARRLGVSRPRLQRLLDAALDDNEDDSDDA
ncbi:MAG TPA: sigma-54 dependent transcriptional regulator [Gemmatimonadaceae bacterium]|nr:sigma-54 dependent transcriptional regulator [Gemmatimonadaceae bacterium]